MKMSCLRQDNDIYIDGSIENSERHASTMAAQRNGTCVKLFKCDAHKKKFNALLIIADQMEILPFIFVVVAV